MANPPLTIGLPVFNGARFLDEALQSILSQTFIDFVLVVSDNGSSDDTVTIVREHAVRDRRVQLIANHENKGAAWNYNRVFAACETELFKWAASDDVLAPTCVERCHQTLVEAGPDTILAFPATQVIDGDGAFLRRFLDPLDLTGLLTPHDRLRHVVASAVYGNVAFGLMRSAALRSTRGHGTYPSADLVLLAELALLGEFRALDEPLFLRREHASMSRRAHASAVALSHWFDPSSKPVRHEYGRLYLEHVRGILRAPISSPERARCLQVLTTTWVRRHDELRTRFRRSAALRASGE